MDSFVSHVPECHLPPKQNPRSLHNGLPVRFLRPGTFLVFSFEGQRRCPRVELESQLCCHLSSPGGDLMETFSGYFVPAEEPFNFSQLQPPVSKGLMRFSGTRQTWRVPKALIHRTDVCQVTLAGLREAELHKNRGVSSQSWWSWAPSSGC